MTVINFFDSDKQSHWLNKIKNGDWGAAKYLYELLIELLHDKKPRITTGTALVVILIYGRRHI